MDTIRLAVLFTILPVFSILAQNQPSQSSWELLGSLSYNHSSLETASGVGLSAKHVYSQDLMLRPSAGYFLTDEVEILFDVHYLLSYVKDSYGYGDYKWWRHRLGCAVGASYNYPASSSFIPFVGTRIGTSWSRIHSEGGVPLDIPWGKPELSFPDFFLGARFLVVQDWAFVFLIEYSKTAPYEELPAYWDKNESTSIGFGFAVFL